jgi:hypothetical protein
MTKLPNDRHGSGYIASVFWLWPQVVYFLPSSSDVNGPPKPSRRGSAWSMKVASDRSHQS